jgi:hypothetical protein
MELQPVATMRKVQTILRGILLRRTKKSQLDGKPILTLPERIVDIEKSMFSTDEWEFYKAVEKRTRIQFNLYLKAGTVMKNYANVLVLLLRLRQACDHPHRKQICFHFHFIFFTFLFLFAQSGYLIMHGIVLMHFLEDPRLFDDDDAIIAALPELPPLTADDIQVAFAKAELQRAKNLLDPMIIQRLIARFVNGENSLENIDGGECPICYDVCVPELPFIPMRTLR